MGIRPVSNKYFVNVSLGRLRKKCEPSEPGAQQRTTSKGDVIHELVFKDISGVLENVEFRQHEEYGNSWILTIHDDKEYALQIQEDSRYGVDLLKKLPNLYRGKKYRFMPYDFEANGKRKIGISITDAEGGKVEGYYQSFAEKPDGTFDVKNLHGFPEFEGNPKDKDDQKIYFTKVTKFLRGQAIRHINNEFLEALQEQSKDGLPF